MDKEGRRSRVRMREGGRDHERVREYRREEGQW